MPVLPHAMDARAWQSFLRAVFRSWKADAQLRVMDAETFGRYEADARSIQDAVACLSSTPHLNPSFLAHVVPPLERVLHKMYRLGDDITAFLLFKQLGSLLEDHGMAEPAARVLAWAGRCGRDLRFFDESQMLLNRAAACAISVNARHPCLIDITGVLGLLCHFTKRWDEAESNYRKSLALLDVCSQAEVLRHCRAPKDRVIESRLMNLLDLHLVRGDLAPVEEREGEILAARSLLARIKMMFRPGGLGMAFAQASEGEILLLEGRLEEAKALLSDQLESLEDQGFAWSPIAPALHRILAHTCAREGKVKEAYDHCRQALQLGLHVANAYEEGMAVEATIDIMSGAIRPRVSAQGLLALTSDDLEILQNLVLLLEQKDWYTGNNHSRAVARLSRLIGEQILLDSPSRAGRVDETTEYLDLQLLEMGGLLHDIGKLRIPWSLLNKANPLSPVEHRILESHVHEGASILRHLGFIPLARLVEEHHEKLDGSGYPAGRKHLSLMGAIVAVTDAYEAMVTPNRRYTTSKNRAAALAEMEEFSGSQFHPRVVLSLRHLLARVSDA